MVSFKINPEKIRDVIGKGGSVIRGLTEETGTTINVEDDGTVTISSPDMARPPCRACGRGCADGLHAPARGQPA